MLSLYPENIHQPIAGAQRRQLRLFIMFLTRASTVPSDFQYQVFHVVAHSIFACIRQGNDDEIQGLSDNLFS